VDKFALVTGTLTKILKLMAGAKFAVLTPVPRGREAKLGSWLSNRVELMESSSSTLKKSLIGSENEHAPPTLNSSAVVDIEQQATVTAPKRRKIKLWNKSVVIVAYIIFAIYGSGGLLIWSVWARCDRRGGPKINIGSYEIVLFVRLLLFIG
jgi:uncharacterized membrane protein YcjF (UPF0283 family)